MAAHTFKTNLVCIDQLRDDQQFRTLAIDYGAEMHDGTSVGDTTRIMTPGMKTATLAAEGFFTANTTTLDGILHPLVGNSTVFPITIGHPDEGTNAAGIDVFVMEGLFADYNRFSSPVGEPSPFDFTAQGNLLGNGTLMSHTTSLASDSNGTGYQLGALSATQQLLVCIHFSSYATFTSVDVIIESDASDTWGGSETTRSTSSFTAADGVVAKVSGAVTDTWWRVRYDVTGTGLAQVAVGAAIVDK